MARSPKRTVGIALWCGVLLLLVGCSASTAGSTPDRLEITMSSPAAGSHAWTVTSVEAISQLYNHVRALTKIPSTAQIACRPMRERYQLTFTQNGTTLLQGSVGACRSYIHLNDNTYRALDGAFWQQVDQAVGQNISPS